MSQRVFVFTTAYWPLIGGAEVALTEIIKRLPEYQFEIITARFKRLLPAKESIGNVTIHRLGWGTKLDKFVLVLTGATYAKWLAKKNKPALVWSMMASYGGLAATSFKKANLNTPYLLSLQEGDDLKALETKMKMLGAWWWFKKIFTKADHVQCISHYLADWAKRMGATCPVTVVPNGIDLKTFYCDQERLDTRTEKIIFTASRLVHKNAVDIIIQALAKLPSNFKLRIAGGGPEEVNLKQLTKKLKVEDKVIFLGNVPNHQLFSELNQASVFVRPSRSEGLGVSFLEAMAAGVPVIATPVGGILDFLKDNQTGFLVPVDDANKLAEKVSYITDPDNQQQVWEVINMARALIKNNYNWDHLAPQISQIFDHLIR
ncbi:MAG: glycosyltransferase family 4 protein [Candidatus Vogelbacteria bacterium]|nr:glycosyltransferase family 4 protein [Candidatus Vogelbacteria bacterium]